MIRILVAASSAVVRAGLESLVSSSPAVLVVGQTTSLATLRQDIAATQPDVVLLEQGPRDDEAGTLAAEIGGTTALVVLTDMPSTAWAAELLRSGARAVLPRDATADEIAAAVAGAAAGFVMLYPTTAETLLPLLAPSRALAPSPAEAALTPREVEVLTMLAEGVGNKTIARRLHISEHTVKFHVGSILAKLNAASRTEAVTLGARRGLIML